MKRILNTTDEFFRLCIKERTEDALIIVYEEYLDAYTNTSNNINDQYQSLLNNPIINNKDINCKIAETLLNDMKTNQNYKFEKAADKIYICTKYADRYFIPYGEKAGKTINIRGHEHKYRKVREMLQELIS